MNLDQLNRRVVSCTRCARLVAYRQEAARIKTKRFQGDRYWAKPVPGFGDPQARMLIVGLAPAPHGSNRTGRMFTGDGTDGMGSSDFLMRALHQVGYANQPSSRRRDDGLKFYDAYMTAIVRCAPPANKPSPQEIRNCQPFLAEEMALLQRLRVVVALGKLAFDQVLRLWLQQGIALPSPRPKFVHGVQVALSAAPTLLGAYHPSRQNTQTGKLTPTMLVEVFQTAKRLST